jgi:hypothetical protein
VVHHRHEVEARALRGLRLGDDVVEQLVVRNPRVREVRHVEAEESAHESENARRASTIPFEMNWKLLVPLAVGALFLLYGTVAVFEAFDRVSHSNSDTIRPFVITMAPVWIVAIAAARVLLQGKRS